MPRSKLGCSGCSSHGAKTPATRTWRIRAIASAGQLLPLLRTFNPQIAEQLARLASISADEEAYWQGELHRLLPALLLPGRPTRGGGRSASTHPEEETVGIEQARLGELHPAVARRVLRAAARRLGARLSFEHTEQLLAMAGLARRSIPGASRAGKFDLPGGITVERSLREIRLTRSASPAPPAPGPAHAFLIPGEVRAPEYGVCLRGELRGSRSDRSPVPRHYGPGKPGIG